MSEDSKVDNMLENSKQLGPSAPLMTLNNGMENGDCIESLANQRTSNGDSACVPSIITQLLQMLETAKARRSANLHSTEESSPSRDRNVNEDPSTGGVSWWWATLDRNIGTLGSGLNWFNHYFRMIYWRTHLSTSPLCSSGVSNIWAMGQGQPDKCHNLVDQLNLVSGFEIKIILLTIIKLKYLIEKQVVIHR